MKKHILTKLLLVSSFLVIASLTGCSNKQQDESNNIQTTSTGNRILVAYFSRYGNTDFPDGVDASTSASIIDDGERYGTTEYVARMVQEYVGGDLFLIETQTPYTDDFDILRDINHQEMAENTLPELKSTVDISQYDTVFIGYPIWASDAPQAIVSFLNEYDLSDKTVIPFCTHDGYGAGSSYRTIADASQSDHVLDGLAIDSDDVQESENTIIEWLDNIGVITQSTAETNIQITIGDTVLEGVLYDTDLAQEIKSYFPLTLYMRQYNDREYYGSVDFYPENWQGGKQTFEDGDITYCDAHHNMAIFYNQSDNPNLSVEVAPIGKVTSNLSIFNQLDSSETITCSIVEEDER